MYNVHFIGIVYFNACTTTDKVALVPNGTRGNEHAPPHYASLFIDSDLHDSDSWWPDQKFMRPLKLENVTPKRTAKVFEFRIPKPAEITFDCQEAILDAVDLDNGLPQLSVVNPRFDLDLVNPDVIARMTIPGGRLQAFRFGDVGVVSWAIRRHSELVTLTARAGNEVRRITLKKFDARSTPEIVFGNTSNLITPTREQQAVQSSGGATKETPSYTAPPKKSIKGDSAPPQKTIEGHFVLYSKIDKLRDEADLQLKSNQLPDVMKLQELNTGHPYLSFLDEKDQIPLPGCTPTCCASKK